MSYLDKNGDSMEQLVDGIRDTIKKVMIANTVLTADALVGATTLSVDNTLRFKRGDQIALFDDNSVFQPSQNMYDGIEIHTVALNPTTTTQLVLEEPLEKSFLLSGHGRLQKALRGAILMEKDVYYGDREVIPFNQVAVTVDPENIAAEWIALQGMLSNEFTCGIMVYVKPKGGWESQDELGVTGQEWAARVCHTYANALRSMFMGNIHFDILVDEAPLRADGCAGCSYVYIGRNVADQWPPDSCQEYEVQDNFHAEKFFSLVPCSPAEPSSSSSTTCVSLVLSTSSVNSSSSSLNSSSVSSESSGSSSTTSTNTASTSSSEVSSSSSISSSTGSSMSGSSRSSESSTSSMGGGLYKVCLSSPIQRTFRMRDKAVLRRKTRYMYDSRVTTAEFGTAQKGKVFMKAAKLNWYGKETQEYTFPQVGLGGNT